ncbi:MAG TPA: hypothetical protein DCY66_12800 [Bacteroides sp.]|nr:hypothetical protein [Bacteroides sp.]
MNKDLSYDKTSIQSIFEYSKRLIGNSLRDVVSEDVVDASRLRGQGKGGLGQMIEELFFQYPVNSDPGPDFREAHLELKATGLKSEKEGGLQIKERLVCDMLDYCSIVNTPFESSLFYLKCRIMLLIFYLYEKGIDKLDLKFIYTVVWQLPEKDLLIIKNDFETFINKIKNGEAHNLSEGDTEYLGACRKGQKGDNLRAQPFSDVRAPKRALSLKPAYMRTVLAYVKSRGVSAVSNIDFPNITKEIATVDELKSVSFENLILQRFQPWIGQSVSNYVQVPPPRLRI